MDCFAALAMTAEGPSFTIERDRGANCTAYKV